MVLAEEIWYFKQFEDYFGFPANMMSISVIISRSSIEMRLLQFKPNAFAFYISVKALRQSSSYKPSPSDAVFYWRDK